MRTFEARKIRRRALRHARIRGHQPRLISHHGALALYGCQRCHEIFECWDSPAIVSGPMPHVVCYGIKAGWLRKLFIKLISF